MIDILYQKQTDALLDLQVALALAELPEEPLVQPGGSCEAEEQASDEP